MILFLPGSGPELEKAPRIYITNIADEKCFFFPNGAGIVEQLERDDHLGGGDSLVSAWGALEERLLRIRLPLGVHCPGFPAHPPSSPLKEGFLRILFYGGSLDSVLWIRIHLDPHSIGCLGSGSVLGTLIRIQELVEIDQNLQINLVFCLSKKLLYLRMYVFWPITYRYFKNIFHVKFNFLWLLSILDIQKTSRSILKIALLPFFSVTHKNYFCQTDSAPAFMHCQHPAHSNGVAD